MATGNEADLETFENWKKPESKKKSSLCEGNSSY